MTEPAFTALLDGRDVDVRLGAAYSSVTYDLNIESTAALTVVVHDQARKLKASGILDLNKDGRLDASVEITADGAVYRLAGCRKDGDVFTLTFEDRAVSRLRSARGKLKPRTSESHVRFARRLCELVGVAFVTPTGVAVATDATPLKHKRLRAAADDRHEKGLAGDAVLTVSGMKADRQQLRNMEVVLGVAAKLQAGPKATLAAMCAAIGESGFRVIRNQGGSKYDGVFQADPANIPPDATAIQARYFFSGGKGFQGGGAIALARAHPDWSPGRIALTVEGSRANFASDAEAESFYEQNRDEGRKIIAEYGGPSATVAGLATGTVLTGLTSTAKPSRQGSQIQRGTPELPNEDSWAAMQRFSAAKGYRVFALRGEVHYAREQDLIDSRPRATISEQSAGVDWINWEHEPRKKVNTASVRCAASLWAAPPGSVVVIKGEGAADGRWLVSSFQRSRDSRVATISLRRGTALLQPQKTTEQPKGPGAVSQAGSGSMFAICRTISDQKRAYLYGGGHGKALKDITPKEPLDCSSSVCLALSQAGLYTDSAAMVSGQLAATFGEPGIGKAFTVEANFEHVWILFGGDNDGWRFDTSPRSTDNNTERGPRLRKGRRESAGFTARRVKGGG